MSLVERSWEQYAPGEVNSLQFGGQNLPIVLKGLRGWALDNRGAWTVDRGAWAAGGIVAFLLSEPAHEGFRGEFASRRSGSPAAALFRRSSQCW